MLFAFADSQWAAGAAAFVGMVNTQGSDRGAAHALEQAILPATTNDADRTHVFAWYNALSDIGGAAGALLAALPALLRDRLAVPELRAYDTTLLVYAALLVAVARAVCCACHVRPSRGVTHLAAGPHALPPSSQREVRRFAGLSALDAVGGGFIGSALIAYFLYARFGVGEGELAPCSWWRD